MSGSDHDRYDGIGIGGPVGESTCSNLFITTFLNSPVSAVLETLTKGSVLSLQLDDPTRSTVTAWTEDGVVAGSVTSGRHAEMVECMRKDFEYVGIVRDIDEGSCEIEVRPKAG
jgi:hypothetical protein